MHWGSLLQLEGPNTHSHRFTSLSYLGGRTVFHELSSFYCLTVVFYDVSTWRDCVCMPTSYLCRIEVLHIELLPRFIWFWKIYVKVAFYISWKDFDVYHLIKCILYFVIPHNILICYWSNQYTCFIYFNFMLINLPLRFSSQIIPVSYQSQVFND